MALLLSLCDAVLLAALVEQIVWEGDSYTVLIAAAVFFAVGAFSGLFRRPLSLAFVAGGALLCCFGAGVTVSVRAYDWMDGAPAPFMPLTFAILFCAMCVFAAAALSGRTSAGRVAGTSVPLLCAAIGLLFLHHSAEAFGTAGWLTPDGRYGIWAAAFLAAMRALWAIPSSPAEPEHELLQKAQQLALLIAAGTVLAVFARAGYLLHEKAPLASSSGKPPYRVSAPFIAQLLVSEDPIFVFHHGIDFKRVRDVIRETVERGTFVRGGSTISMQLSKMEYLGYEKTLLRKAQQFALALFIETVCSKDEILAAYLNGLPFGEGTIGLREASQRFFRREPIDLNADQARLLVVTVPDPSLFNPSMNAVPKQPRFSGYTIAARVHRYGPRLRDEVGRIHFAGPWQSFEQRLHP